MGFRTLAAAFFVVAYLVVQLGVPVRMLAEDRPAQFGWQMFSDFRTLPSIHLVFPDSMTSVDPRQLLIYHRIDLDYCRHLERHLCLQTSAEALIMRRARPRSEWVYRCP